MSNRDITHNPNIIRALLRLKEDGIYGELIPQRKNYGIIGFKILDTVKYLVEKAQSRLKENKLRSNTESYIDKDQHIIVTKISLLEKNGFDDKEYLEYQANNLRENLKRKGINSYVEFPDGNTAYISIDIDSVSKYIAKKFKATVGNNLNTFLYYDRENFILQAHVWTGETPELVKKLRQLENKGDKE